MKKQKLTRNNIPLYVQLEQILKSQIMRGEFVPGRRIPSEKELAEIYGVSTITARQAILNLVQEGILQRRQGKGTFVQEKTNIVKNIMTFKLAGGIEDVVPEGLSFQKVEVKNICRVIVTERIAGALEIDEGEEVIRILRRRTDKGVAISYTKNYLPVEIGEQIRKEDLLAHSMLHILRDKVGISFKEGIQYILAGIADYEIATALSVSISSPVLYLETIFIDEQDKPVEFVQTFFRADHSRYTLRFAMSVNRNA